MPNEEDPEELVQAAPRADGTEHHQRLQTDRWLGDSARVWVFWFGSAGLLDGCERCRPRRIQCKAHAVESGRKMQPALQRPDGAVQAARACRDPLCARV